MMEQRSPELVAAYAACREIAKREAKNFYYAFRVLPQHKSDAMCAVYAFMRKADDLADDERLSIAERREAMARWTAEWQQSSAGTTDAVFLALRNTQRRFGISDDLLAQLVKGTTLDLQESVPGIVDVQVLASERSSNARDLQVYATFEELYRYCYLVASVVGLTCIRIFGFSDPRAEKLAEHVGIAFQLTNILRDVKEDAERGRVYLPLDDIAAANSNVEALVLATAGGVPSAELISLLRREIKRAQVYYLDADQLVPLLDKDSQAAMRVLVTIYRELLERIAADPAAVFRTRVSVPTARKLAILGLGTVASLRARGGR